MTTPHEQPTHEATALPQDPTPQVPQAVYLPAVPAQQPVVADWVRDTSSGVPVRVIRPAPAPVVAPPEQPPTPTRDPWPARLLAGGASVSMTAAVLGWMADDLAKLKGPALALAAVLVAVWLLVRSGGGKQRGSVNVSVRIDNRRG